MCLTTADAIMGVSFFRESAPADFATFDVSFFAMCVSGEFYSLAMYVGESVNSHAWGARDPLLCCITTACAEIETHCLYYSPRM